MRSRAALAALTKDVATLRERVEAADLGAIPLLVDDGTPESRAGLDAAVSQAPDYGIGVVAVVVDVSAGVGDLDADGHVMDDGPDDDDDAPVLTIVRPPRRVAWDDLWPLPGIRPGKDPITGREWYQRLPDGRLIFGQTVDGDLVSVDALGPYIVEADREPST